MTVSHVIDGLLVVALLAWLAGVVLRFIERRRLLRHHFPDGSDVDGGKTVFRTPVSVDGRNQLSPQFPNSRTVTLLLVAGTVALILAGGLSWYFDTNPRAPAAAEELNKALIKSEP